MRVLYVIFLTSLRQAFRRKFLAGLVLTCLFVLFLSLALSQLSLDDKGRLTVDFGLASLQLLLVALSVFFGSSFISQDLDQKTLWLVLTKPVRPSLFFLARYLALSFLLLLSTLVLSLLLIVFFIALEIPIQAVLFYALFSCFLESVLLLSFVLLFSSFVSSYLVLFYCLSFFIISHFLDNLIYFVDKSPDLLTTILLQLIRFIPNLEAINWKSQVVYQTPLAFNDFASAVFYIFLWIGFTLSLSLILLEKREL